MKFFYASREQTNPPEQHNEADLLFSDAPPSSSTVVDETFVNTVWDWLEKHQDIEIRNLDDEAEFESELSSKRTRQRIFTNEEIAWQAIAGHGVDYSRIPKLSFDCLSVIAAHGPSGVLQPTIVQITGQDKRSVPHRTDLLAENGYIIKLQAYDGRHKTSLLKLRKFAEADGSSKPILDLERTRIFPQTDLLAQQDDDERDKVYDDMVRLLQENDNIVAIVDLCRAFNIRRNTALKQEFLLSIDRFVESGCARLVQALLQDSNNRTATCLQLVREPTDRDREAFVGTSTKQGLPEDDRDESLVDQEVENEKPPETEQVEDGNEQRTVQDSAEVQQRIPPQWTSDTLQENFIFNIIDKTGPAGISSMELHKRSMGPFWKKSLDDLLLRLTDVWQVSQPKHLKHLGIVRDTEVDGRNQHFHFRTFPHFEKAVEMGLTSWEAVTENSRDARETKKRGRPRKSATLTDVDEYGFPKFNPTLFADEEGRASLTQCAAPARKAVSRMKDLVSTSTKDTPQSAAPTPITLQTGKKRRKDAEVRRERLGSKVVSTLPGSRDGGTPITTLERGDSNVESGANDPAVAQPTPIVRATLLTGRKKRKDAGIRRGPRGLRLTPGSQDPVTPETPTTVERPQSVAEDDAHGPAIAPTLPGDKRRAPDAQFADSPRPTKMRRLRRTPKSSSIVYDDDTDAEEPMQDIAEDQMDHTGGTNSRVYFNSPDALKMRFEHRHLPGRKPSTKIAVFKFDRLQELAFFGPNGAGPVVRGEEDVHQNGVETDDVAEEPPRKKTKLDDTEAQSIAADRTVEGAPSSPLTKKKPGRLPKTRLVGSGDLFANPAPPAMTFDTTSPTDSNVSHAEAKTQIVKLPIGRAILEEFVKQRREITESGDNGPNHHGTYSKAYVLQHPKVQWQHRGKGRYLPLGKETSKSEDRPQRTAVDQSEPNTMGSAADDGPAITFRDMMDSSPISTASVVPLVTDAPGRSLIVKFGLRHSPSTILGARTEAALAQVPSIPTATRGSIPGLNIVRPYFDSLVIVGNGKSRPDHEIISEARPRHTSKAPLSTHRPGGSFQSLNESGDGESRTKELPAIDADDVDDTTYVEEDDEAFGGLSELVPVDIEGEDNYREKVNQKAGIPRTGGFIQLRRTTIVTETMRKAGGVFPGDHEMWWPFVTAWQKRDAHLPDRRTVENVVNLLVKQKQLKKFSFAFEDKSGKTIERHILTEPSISPLSAEARKVQQSIIDSYPFRYLPKEVDIAKHLRDKARQVPVTQGGHQPVAEDNPKDNYAADTPTQSRSSRPYTLKRSGGSKLSAYFKDHRATSSPRITKSTSFAPRPILKIQEDYTPRRADTDDDDADTATDGDSEDDTDSDESLEELSPQQAALQGSFGVDNYSHSTTVTGPGQRRGKRPMQTLRVGKRPVTVQPPKRIPKQPVKVPNTYLNRCTQVFHPASGTFGTIFSLSRRGGRRLKKILPTVPGAPIVTNNYSAPQGLDEIIKRSNALGHKTATPSDSRFYHFSNEVDGVNAWERSMIIAGRSMSPPLGTIFINHSLKQPHDLAIDLDANTDLEFVEGSHRPFVLDTGRRKRIKTTQATTPKTSTSARIPSIQFASPYVSPYDGLSVAGYGPTASTSRSTANMTTFNTQGRSPSQPLLPLRPGNLSQSAQTLKPTAIGNTKRPFPYRARKQGTKRSAFDPAQDGDRDSDTEYRPGQQAPTKKTYAKSTKKNLYKKFSPEEFKRLAVAVAVVRMLCGGTGSPVTNYPAVALALGSKYDVNEVKHHWQLPRKHGYDLVFAKKVQQAMYEPFLQAYENGRLARIDFDDLQHTDWTALLSWTEAEILPLVEGELLGRLPEDRGAVQVISKFTSSASMAEDAASRSSASLDQNHILEKSWIRAVMITKEETYDESVASSKLRDITPDVLKTATEEMLASNTIKWKKVDRQQPGRSYKISAHVLSQFKRWQSISGVDFLTCIATARTEFVTHLQEHDRMELNTDVTEAQLLVLTNMVAQAHLRMSPVLPEPNDDFNAPWPKLSKWGQLDHVYDEQGETPSLDIKVVYKKTPLFASNHGLRIDVDVPTESPAFLGGLGARIPIWIDINGNVVEEVWKSVVESILHLLVHTPGCTATSIERAHHSKLWEWEVDIVLAWMETVGLATRFGAGKEIDGAARGAWRAGEWWYCASLVMETSSEGHIDADVVEV